LNNDVQRRKIISFPSLALSKAGSMGMFSA